MEGTVIAVCAVVSVSSSRLGVAQPPAAPGPASRARPSTGIRLLVGSGDKIGLATLPFVVVGLALNLWRPALFSLGEPSVALRVFAASVTLCGVVNWAWSVVLIVTKVPKRELITSGPYAIVKHPLYTGVALLVMPWAGVLLDSWLGFVLGGVLYVASRIYSREEEESLARDFGAAWTAYCGAVKVPWL